MFSAHSAGQQPRDDDENSSEGGSSRLAWVLVVTPELALKKTHLMG
jgi:hypothetical protein